MARDLAQAVKNFNDLKDNFDNIHNYQEANLNLENYAMSLPKVSQKNFDDFAYIFCKLAPKSDEISFHSLWVMLVKRNNVIENSDRDLFDDISRTPFKLDKKSLNNLISILGKNTKKFDRVPKFFINKFSEFITDKIKIYPFKNKEITELQNTLRADYANSDLVNSYGDICGRIFFCHKEKKNRDVEEINSWAYKFAYRTSNITKKLSYRSTYINLLYEALVKENDIRDINPEIYYHNHRKTVKAKIDSFVGTIDAKGKTIVKPYAINKVYKSIGIQDKFKHNCILNAIKLYKQAPFYDDTINIINALDGGEKNRDIKKPIQNKNYER